MSVNNAKSSGGVASELDAIEKSPNFESPNFESVSDEEQIKKEKAAAERKKAETVDIDGIPIDEKELKFKVADIKKKGKTDFFVNVEGAEERKRDEEKRIREEAAEAKREAEEKAREAEEKARAARAAADKKAAEAKKRATAEDNRVISELKQKAEARKKEIRRAKGQARRKKVKTLLFARGHKFITIGILLLIAAAAVFFVVIPIVDDMDRKRDAEIIAREEEEGKKRLEEDESYIIEPILAEADGYLENFDLSSADNLYNQALNKVSTDELRSYIYLHRSQTTAQLMYDIEPERVLNDAKKAYELNHDSYEATRWLAEVYERRGEKEKADTLRNKLESMAPDEDDDQNGGEWGEG